MNEQEKIEKIVRFLASEVAGKIERGKGVKTEELVLLAVYLLFKKIDKIEEELLALERAFYRLDALLDVVKELKDAIDNRKFGYQP